MGVMVILLVLDDGVYVCICTVYSSVFKEYQQHAFVYNSHLSALDKSECFGAIIDNIAYAPTCVMEEKDRKTEAALNNMLRKLFDGNCIVGYALKVMENDFS